MRQPLSSTPRPILSRSPGRVASTPALAALLGMLALGSCSTSPGKDTPQGSGAARTASTSTLVAQGINDFIPLAKLAVPTPTRVLWGAVDYTNAAQVAAAVRLGKALFWDQQVGEYKDVSRPLATQTDANGEPEYAAVTGMACASCHFLAGADARTDAGVFRKGSVGVIASRLVSQQQDGDELCQLTGAALQRTGANTPPATGALYNRLQFWDGRANNLFNGRNPFGDSPGERSDFPVGAFQDNSSLASQADGPANNPVEMICDGQNWESLGKKLLTRRPLGTQIVAAGDSVFAGFVSGGQLTFGSYREMVDAAFPETYASDADKAQYFGMIWGQAVMAYERTLRPDQTPLDRYLAGNRSALSSLASRGFEIFKGKGGCTNCHVGTVMTDASVDLATRLGVLREGGGTQGFHNLGVTNENDNVGRMAFSGLDQDKGAFKTPGLRNVGLTAPYMHDGSLKTLDDVIEFYAKGGKSVFGVPTPGANNPHRDPKMQTISLSTDDRKALKEFLLNGLTDSRVTRAAGPFDHPSLSFNDGSTVLCATDAAGTRIGTGCQ